MIKTTELLEKLLVTSEEICKCEDENFNRMSEQIFKGKSVKDSVSITDIARILRVVTDYSRFTTMRTTCKVLQDLGVIEADIDVLNNKELREAFVKMDMCKGYTPID
ncbi:MAG: hypothetical protein IJA10_10625 [Lachnospiraceae bacterium]|nr:hypothetical protein [Lachnospiraceae bacterium]